MTAFAPLVQIRSVYSAEWNHLALSVESGASEWTVRVQDTATHRVLYTGRRAGAAAAQEAGAEFAIFRALGPSTPLSPRRLAASLPWQHNW